MNRFAKFWVFSAFALLCAGPVAAQQDTVTGASPMASQQGTDTVTGASPMASQQDTDTVTGASPARGPHQGGMRRFRGHKRGGMMMRWKDELELSTEQQAAMADIAKDYGSRMRALAKC